MHGAQLQIKQFLSATIVAVLLLSSTTGLAWQIQPAEPFVEPKAAETPPATDPDGSVPTENDFAPLPQSSRRGAPAEPGRRPVVQAAPISPESNSSEDGAPVDDEPLASQPADAAPLADVQTASFQGVVPGVATIEDVKQALGEPVSVMGDAEQSQLVYKVGPFPKVELLVTKGVATSIVIHLREASQPGQIAQELGLGAFRPAPIPDDNGRLIGQAYPERGVLFVFSDDVKKSGVTHIVLEPISAEPFILRVQNDDQHRYQENLVDLDYAQGLDANDARVYVLRAQILGSIGRVDEALENMSTAVQLEGQNIRHRLLGAKLLVVAGENDRAVILAEAIAGHEETDALTRAEAELLWGDILASGGSGEYQQASQHHVKAVELAVKLASGDSNATRRSARRVAIDAHLGVARDIALGNWRNKDETVQRWLDQATKIAADAIARDKADPLLRFVVERGKLAALAGMSGKLDALEPAREAVKLIQTKFAGEVDPLYRNQLQWELAEALFDASLAQQRRGRTDDAIAFGRQAVALFEKSTEGRETKEMHHYQLGRVCFRVGSYYAVGKTDHQTAIEWYQKSLLHFAQPLPVAADAEIGLHGERYVSMGASYWKQGQHDAGVKLTQEGVKLIEQAVQAGKAEQETLAVPYGNLAAMHRHLGHEDQAEEISILASKIETDATKRR